MVVNKCEFKPLSLTFKPLVLDRCLSARCCSVALPLPTTTSSPSLAFSRPDVSFITEELTALSREDVGLSPSNGAWQSTRWTQQLGDDGLRSSSSSFFFSPLSLFRRKGKDQYLSLCCAFASTVQFHRGELNQAPVDKFHVRSTWWELTNPAQDQIRCWRLIMLQLPILI